MRRHNLLLMLAPLLLTGCDTVSEMVKGKDNTDPPAVLVEFAEISEDFLAAPSLNALDTLAFRIRERELDTRLFELATSVQERAGEETGVRAHEVEQ